MGKITQMKEKKPAGGSSLGGMYERAAFQGYLFPQGRQLERDGTQRVQRKEGRELVALDDANVKQQAMVCNALGAEVVRPGRLRRAVIECREKGTHLKPSFSSPEIGIKPERLERLEREEAERARMYPSSPSGSAYPAGSEIPLEEEIAEQIEEEPELTEHEVSRKVNSRWYPALSLCRGTLKYTLPMQLAYGVDPDKDKGHECPFYEAPKHRFKAVQDLPEAKPRTPPRSLRWKSDEHWNNPDLHFSLKVNHTVPKRLG
eukprot:TRINITY_DN83440_c0_g1_i1.p1 TRINITY_DN83440_c0_g1~~TRINITY_DN83440_c0_g1_i1.p1  ORF type:complete len:260 (-),score=47.18 TRINITY_DN83440_c0_g1_i1:153-932(-)